MNDDFEGIFENLSPDDFNVQTTAIHEIQGTYLGVPAFNDFVEEQILMMKVAYASSNGQYTNPVSTLVASGKQRLFRSVDGDTVKTLVTRLNTEAKAMNAKWVFTSIKTKVGSRLVPVDVKHDVTDESVINTTAPTLVDGVIWFAEAHEDGEVVRRVGILVDDDGVLTRQTEANQRMALLERILLDV